MPFNMTTTEIMVGISAILATFVASVMAEEQNNRLRNGTFGAVAGSSMGGIAALLTKNDNLLIIGIFGSALGALLGWVVYLLLSWFASTERGRQILEYHVGGLKSLREHLRKDDQKLLEAALDQWGQGFSKLLNSQQFELMNNWPSGSERDRAMRTIIRSWLVTVIDVFNLVLDAVAKKPDYNLRVTIIIFGKIEDKILGRHWISYSGRQPRHRTHEFDQSSIAFKVLKEEFQSPCLAHTKDANRDGQKRGEHTFHSFYAFRLNKFAVLSLDWPGHLETGDPYLQIARDIFHIDLNPSITELLESWSKPIQNEVDLNFAELL